MPFLLDNQLQYNAIKQWKKFNSRHNFSQKWPVTIIPLTIGPIVGQSLVSILGSREIPFPGSRKKIETPDSRVSLTPLALTVASRQQYLNYQWIYNWSSICMIQDMIQTRCMKLPDVDHIGRSADKSADAASKATNQHLLIEGHHYTRLINSLLCTLVDAKASQGICHLNRQSLCDIYFSCYTEVCHTKHVDTHKHTQLFNSHVPSLGHESTGG